MPPTPVEKFGIANLILILDLGVEFGNVAGYWKSKDGKGPAELFRLTDEVIALGKLEWNKITKEIKDLSGAELEMINAHIAKKLEIPQKGIEGVVEESFSIGIKLCGVVRDSFELARLISQLKAPEPEPEAAKHEALSADLGSTDPPAEPAAKPRGRPKGQKNAPSS